MFYAITSSLALILNLIINRASFVKSPDKSDSAKTGYDFVSRYRTFLIASNLYFIADIGWGLLYEEHRTDFLFPLLYLDCMLYFLFMLLTMLTWIRSIIAYLDKNGPKSRILIHVIWSIFTIGLINLVINYFHPFIFSFNSNHEYITEPGRHIAFLLQILIYLITTLRVFHTARKSYGSKKIRYTAVGFSCLMLFFFLILQILDPRYPFYAAGLIITICVIHTYVEAGERKEKEIYDNIARSLAEDYETMYYINIETGEYLEFSASKEYASMKVPIMGRNFYEETHENIERYVHPDDREFAKTLYSKDTMLKNLEERNSYSYKYRIMVENFPRHFQFTVMRANDRRHFILYAKDIEDEITAENMRLEIQKKNVTFTQIAEILAVNYDVIYYVDAKNSSYTIFECRKIYGRVNMQVSGDDFFADVKKYIPQLVHKNDRDLVSDFIDRDHLISTLSDQKTCTMDYRIVVAKHTNYARITVQKTANSSHYIIGVENIDDEIKKEKQHLKALNTEKELARRDELTGVKNKTAYKELEKSVQSNIDNGMDYLPFALVVCDANDLKKINDTLGHAAGDEYIKNSVKLLCNIFDHSPVFRIGGDEFVVFLRGDDYTNRQSLMKSLHSQIQKNIQTGSGPSIASGIAEFNPEKDTLVSEIFDRADKEMYRNKKTLKTGR